MSCFCSKTAPIAYLNAPNVTMVSFLGKHKFSIIAHMYYKRSHKFLLCGLGQFFISWIMFRSAKFLLHGSLCNTF